MKRGGGVHTVPAAEGRGWWNKVDGKVLSRHRIKREAELAGREIARRLQVEHTIHREDGQIGEKNSYGNDPFPPQDGRQGFLGGVPINDNQEVSCRSRRAGRSV